MKNITEKNDHYSEYTWRFFLEDFIFLGVKVFIRFYDLIPKFRTSLHIYSRHEDYNLHIQLIAPVAEDVII